MLFYISTDKSTNCTNLSFCHGIFVLDPDPDLYLSIRIRFQLLLYKSGSGSASLSRLNIQYSRTNDRLVD